MHRMACFALVSDVAALGRCPIDDHELTAPVRGPAWCPQCEWNLDAYQSRPTTLKMGRFARWLDRTEHRIAFRLDKAQFDDLRGQRPIRPGLTKARLALITTSIVLLAATCVLAGFGVDLIVYSHNALVVVGVLFVLIGIELRPRLGRHRPGLGQLDPDEAPALRGLVRQVAAELGTSEPAIVSITPDFNAFCGRLGLRRRAVLTVGLPLWAALDPQARVALLGHELGHLVNGDPGQALLSQPALQTFGRLAMIFDPHALFPRHRGLLARLMFFPFLWLFSRLALVVHLAMHRVALRDSTRAEYLADAVAVRVAGTKGASDLMDRLVFARAASAAVQREAGRSSDPATWQSSARDAITELARSRRRYEQLSIREETSMLATHPPAGRRARMVRSWPAVPAQFQLSAADSARIDEELRGHYARVARNLR